MKRSNKIKVMSFFRNINNNTFLMVALSLVFSIIAILVLTLILDFSMNEIINNLLLCILQSLIVFVFLTLFFSLKFGNKLEDSDKLTQNYCELCDFYRNDNLLEHKQICDDLNSIKLACKYTQNIQWCNSNAIIKFPIIFLCEVNNNLVINDTNKKYEPPILIMNNFDTLFKAHSYSNIYNNIMFRLNDFKENENNIELDIGRTEYFYSIITNRSMDYSLNNNINLRRIFVYNQSIGPLSTSQLSNHIGFNAIVITADNKIVFVNRFNNMSIEKNNLGLGVQASVKYKYVIKEKDLLKGLYNSIHMEIKDELNVEIDDIEKCNIIALYRDLVEGGKPQFLVQYNLNITAKQLSEKFKKLTKQSNKYLERDGDNLIFLDKKDVLNNSVTILPDGIAGNFLELNKNNEETKTYKWFYMVPSSTSSIIMWLKLSGNKEKMNGVSL